MSGMLERDQREKIEALLQALEEEGAEIGAVNTEHFDGLETTKFTITGKIDDE